MHTQKSRWVYGFVLFVLLTLGHETIAAAMFHLSEIPLPENSEAVPKAINENGDVVGYIKDTNGISKAFYWTAGQVKMLTAFDGETEALAMNNHGVIVGRAKRNGVWTAWLYENGSSIDLETTDDESVATGVNDDGVVIGNIVGSDHLENGYLLRPEKIFVTCCTASTGGPLPSTHVRAINNNGSVIADIGGAGYLMSDIQTPDIRTFFYPNSQVNLLNYGNGSGVNGAGAVGGFFRYRLGNIQAGIWRNGWTTLGAPLEGASEALGINDHDEAVGYAGDEGMFWKNGMGAELQTLASVPENVKITAGVGVNNKTVVLVALQKNGKSGAGILQPLVDAITLPTFKVVEPTDGSSQYATNLPVRIAAEGAGTSMDAARVVLHQRSRMPAYGAPGIWWVPPTCDGAPYRTNRISAETISTVFENLPVGQYAVAVEVESAGMKLHLPAVFVAVAREARLEAYRVNLAGEFEFGMSGSPGVLHAVEISTNFLNWIPIEPGSEGRLFARAIGGTNSLFVRARAVTNGSDYFAIDAPPPPQAPKSLPKGEAEFWSMDNQFHYGFQLSGDGFFTGGASAAGIDGTYTYSADGTWAHFRAVASAPRVWSFDAVIEYPVGLSLSSITITYFRAQVQTAGANQSVVGRFWWQNAF